MICVPSVYTNNKLVTRLILFFFHIARSLRMTQLTTEITFTLLKNRLLIPYVTFNTTLITFSFPLMAPLHLLWWWETYLIQDISYLKVLLNQLVYCRPSVPSRPFLSGGCVRWIVLRQTRMIISDSRLFRLNKLTVLCNCLGHLPRNFFLNYVVRERNRQKNSSSRLPYCLLVLNLYLLVRYLGCASVHFWKLFQFLH